MSSEDGMVHIIRAFWRVLCNGNAPTILLVILIISKKSFCRGADGKVIEERINADDHLINSSLSLLADLPTNTTVELIDITGTPFWRIEGVSISEYENASLICFIEKESSYLREVNLRVVESIGYGMFESH
jgi:hypothetical protein